MIRKTLSGSLVALALMGSAYAGGGSSFAGGFAGGLAAGVVNGLMQQRQQTVVVKEKTVVVHDHSSTKQSSTHHHAADTSASPSPKPEKVEATPAPTVAPIPAPTPVVVRHDPTLVFTNPQKIDEPTDLNEIQRRLLTDKDAVKAYFEYFFQHTKPNFTLSDSSLFMEVKVGAYNYMVAKIAMNTPDGSTLEQGFVIDLKNQFCTTVDLDTYHQFMHTGNISLLGEHELNPLE